MKIALIDDEVSHIDTLENTLTDSLAELGLAADLIDTFTVSDDFFVGFEKGKYDIVILDIFMDGENGIDVARRIRRIDTSVSLAFCTSSNDFASQSYEVEAKYYLQKPISAEKVTAMLNRFNIASIERSRSVKLPDGFRIPIRQILYTDYQNHSVSFYIKDGDVHTVYMLQKDAEAMLLHNKGFCAVNKGTIVNYAGVSRLSSGTFIMKNGKVIPIARRRLKDIEIEYKQFRFEQMDAEVSE